MDALTFRTNFPEFNSTTTYPDSVINYWIGVGGRMLNTCRWGNLYDDGLQLFVAHNIALEQKAIKDAAAGGVPGTGSGIVASKQVDKVSVSYDTAAAMEKDAGHWNLTIYGTRFIRLSKLLGAGGIQAVGCNVEVLPGVYPFY